MRGEIAKLKPEVINQIAAGEVVENPASAAKELVENSLDAGATEIAIESSKGGIERLSVRDNGWGMSREELLLALERHATSKLTRSEELVGIETFGFRGEALAALAAAAEMEILSTPIEAMSGTQVEVAKGHIIRCQEAARPQGTTLTLSHLFAHLPARRAFLDSPRAEGTRLTRTLTTLALAHPEIRFSYKADDKLLFTTKRWPCNPEGIHQRLEELLGKKSWVPTALPVQAVEESGLSLVGWISAPEGGKPNRLGQYLYLERRPIFSLFLSEVIREAYGMRLTEKHHPSFLLHLSLPPTWVDLNVHPQKREVRLREKERVRTFLLQALWQTLQREASPSFKPRAPLPPLRLQEPIQWKAPLAQPRLIQKDPSPSLLPPLPHLIGHWGPYGMIDAATLPPSILPPPPSRGVYLLHMVRAAARIRYEKMTLQQQEAVQPSQGLLHPQLIDLSPAAFVFYEELATNLQQMGFSLRSAGGRTLLIDGIPAGAPLNHAAQALQEDLETLSSSPLAKKRERFAAHTALAWANHSPPEPHQLPTLLKELLTCQNPSTCPLGRPLGSLLSLEELNKRFP